MYIHSLTATTRTHAQFPWAISFQWLAVFVVHITVHCDVMISSELVCGIHTSLHTQTKHFPNVICDLGGRSNIHSFGAFTSRKMNLLACMSMQLIKLLRFYQCILFVTKGNPRPGSVYVWDYCNLPVHQTNIRRRRAAVSIIQKLNKTHFREQRFVDLYVEIFQFI